MRKMDGKTLVMLQSRLTVVSYKMVNLLMWLKEMMKLLFNEDDLFPSPMSLLRLRLPNTIVLISHTGHGVSTV